MLTAPAVTVDNGISLQNRGAALSPTYNRLRAVLVRYMSESIADSTLAVACRKVGVTPETLGPQHLETLIDQVSHGIRLFCPPDKVQEMMLEIAAVFE